MITDTLTSNFPLKSMGGPAVRPTASRCGIPAVGLGIRVMADSIRTVTRLDPRNVWFLFLDGTDAYVAMLITARVVEGVICFAWMRRRHRFTFWGSAAGTLVFLVGTVFLDEARLHSTSVVVAALPAIIWQSERLLEKPALRRAIELSLGWTLVSLAGSVAYILYLPVLALAWILAIWLASGRPPVLMRFLAWYSRRACGRWR